MKKIIILFATIFLISFQTIAEETSQFEDLAWKVISERLFNGKNSEVFRYEGEIRFQFKGDPEKQDTLILNEIIKELNQLMEVAQAKLVDTSGNFIITISSNNDGAINFILPGNFHDRATNIGINRNYLKSIEERKEHYYFDIIQNLTVLYQPQNGYSSYGGILDSQRQPEKVIFTDIDKGIIRLLYSKDFYKNLKKNVSNQKGYLFYLNMRFENILKYASTILGIILSIICFVILLSKRIFIKKNISLKQYLINSSIIFIMVFTIYILYILPKSIVFASLMFAPFLISNFFAIFFIWLFVITMLFYIEKLLINKNLNFIQKQAIKFLLTFCFIICTGMILSHLIMWFIGLLISNFHIPIIIRKTDSTLIFFALIISLLRVFYDFLVNYTESMVNKKDVELARMKELKNQAELNALHSRINPHFLYNSLNSIAGLAHSDPDKTEKMATSLSSLFRYSINKEDKTYSTVNEELEMVEKYLEVEKVRFGERLDYSIDADENVRGKDIPKFIIQPLVENALKHGLSKITGMGKLKINVLRQEKDLIIQVFDNGPYFPDEPVKGYGLQNLHDKLQILYGDEAILNWQNGENKNIQI
ncbi:MAG: histidine kinase, partial [Prolixibacteraceae bacterium]|nr:histidine kinase [Prolixibacteraceae bacterium]